MDIDTFCPLTGLHWFGTTTFADSLVDDRFRNGRSMALGHGLIPSDDASECSRRYAMICVAAPERRLTSVNDLLWPPDETGNYPCPTKFDESNTLEVFNLLAGSIPTGDIANWEGEVDVFMSLDSSLGLANFMHNSYGTGLAVNLWAYLIFRHACPRILPHILFKMHRDQSLSFDRHLHWGTFRDVDYGPTWGTFGQSVSWHGLGRSRVEDEMVWPGLLDRNKPIPEILDDAWNGDGSLWVTAEPNIFPIIEAASALPLPTFPTTESQEEVQQHESRLMACPVEILLEIAKHVSPRHILSLMAVSKIMYNFLINHIDNLTYQYIRDNQPWLLPAGPVPFADPNYGYAEIDAWEEDWEDAGIDPERIEQDAPWFAYARECSHSMSMRSRRRIWGIAKQIEQLAIQGNYI